MTTAIDRARAVLTSAIGERVLVDEPLGARTTFRVGGSAALFVDASSTGDLEAVAAAAEASGLAVLVIGRGSNMLVDDDGFDGIVVSIAELGDEIAVDLERAICTVGGGVELPRVARQTAALGLTGFEWAVGVPGSIGGATRMNAGGHGSDMAESLIDVEVFDFQADAPVRTVPAAELGLRFRSSALEDTAVVVRARLQLAPGDAATSKQQIAEIVRWRRAHQPGGQNCGSVFVNPIPGAIAAGGLIEEAGLRGMRVGTAAVSDKHANFIQADPGGSATDVRSVIERVRQRVGEHTGYRLRSEVRMVGFGHVEGASC